MNIFKVSSSASTKSALMHLLSRNISISSKLFDKNYYEILRLEPNASQTEIKEAYYKLSKVYHPDIAQDENSLRMFRSITEAYDILGNVRSRIQYDKQSGIPSIVEETSFRSTPTGYRDTDEGVVGPDYEKFLRKKTAQEDWEDKELKDRRLEVIRKRDRMYMDDPNFLKNPLDIKLLKFGMGYMLLGASLYYVDWLIDT